MALNIKGVGYNMHYSVYADKGMVPVSTTEPYTFDYGEFFVNEKKSKTVTIQNSGDFNYDYIWKRMQNKYVTIKPESGTIKKGETETIEIVYLPMNAHHLKNYK